MSIDPAASNLSAHGVAYASQIAAAARRHGVDPDLLAAVAAQETGGPGSNSGRNVVGDGGHGHGLFQIDDRWHGFASTSAAMDPGKNADYAAGMLSGLLARYGGNVHAALSAYNSGSATATGTTTHWADGSTLGYADSVLRHYRQIAGEPAPDAPQQVAQSTAIAEAAQTAASVGSLQVAAQRLPPLPAPTLPSLHHPQSYRRASTDYLSLVASDTDSSDS